MTGKHPGSSVVVVALLLAGAACSRHERSAAGQVPPENAAAADTGRLLVDLSRLDTTGSPCTDLSAFVNDR